MPLAIIYTNASSGKTSFCLDMSKLLAKILREKEELVTVHLLAGQNMVRNGSEEPNAYMYLYHAKGFGTVEIKRELSKEIMDYVSEQLDIPASRIFIIFKKPVAEDIGIGGGLLSDFD